ncbi:hypothetical protein NDU88_005573 [Pleurodeles waltl]|uniref:Uncharacterized protein n=1 Tax=Pleurodeles waltl TaxID=8319 RepID=A0AAV7WBE0_PLEWA|nr:hypothetical protein NDU88_005573 [Pleurodeles waltl]
MFSSALLLKLLLPPPQPGLGPAICASLRLSGRRPGIQGRPRAPRAPLTARSGSAPRQAPHQLQGAAPGLRIPTAPPKTRGC